MRLETLEFIIKVDDIECLFISESSVLVLGKSVNQVLFFYIFCIALMILISV